MTIFKLDGGQPFSLISQVDERIIRMTQHRFSSAKRPLLLRTTLVATLVWSLTACSTVPNRNDQTAIGVGTGAVIGGALGNVIGKNTDGTVIGAALGGLIGGIVGHNYEDKQAEIMGQPSASNSQVIRDAVSTNGLDMLKMADGSMRVHLSGDAGFNTGSAVIRDNYLSTLEQLSGVINASANSRVVIIGHTDNVGSEMANQNLSLARASSVRHYLESTGTAASQMQVYGRGASQPIASNETADGRARNRRVEVFIYPASLRY